MQFQSTLGTAITLVAAAVVVGSVVAPGALADARAESLFESPSEVPTMEDATEEPAIDINCTEEEARIAAPDNYEYSITVASVGISPSGTTSRSSSGGMYDGNETVSIEGDEFTFVFVTDASTEETVASAYENCAVEESAEAGTTERRTTTDEDVPAIRIDCNESTVQVVAPDSYVYGLSVGSVAVAPGDLDSSSFDTSEEGNASIPFDGELVYAFVEGESSDEPTASTLEYCGGVPADETDANRTESTTENSLETEN